MVRARQTSTNTIGCLDFLKKEKKQKNYWKQETENKNVIVNDKHSVVLPVFSDGSHRRRIFFEGEN